MPARRVKTYYKELGHRMHREHRSMRGRNSKKNICESKEFNAKKDKINIKNMKKEINKFL